MWDGRTEAGQVVNDGVYRFSVSAVDRAGNRALAVLDNILVNTEQPKVSLMVNDPWFSPNGDSIKDSLLLYPSVSIRGGLVSWTFAVENADGYPLRMIKGNADLPSEIAFDGKDDSGRLLPEGRYRARFTAEFRNGSKPSAQSPEFTLDISAPTARVAIDHEAFSPNGDGKLDTMIFRQTASTEWLWTGEIRREGSSASTAPTRLIRFEDSVPDLFEWNGRTDQGSLAQDGFYEYILVSTDRAGNRGRSSLYGLN